MYRIAILAALATLAFGAAVPAEAPVDRDVDAPATDYCAWSGYGETNFRDYYAELIATTTGCIKMPSGGFRTALFSAKVNQGGKVCLWANSGCQVIDTAGYRDMSSLPEYNYWKCGAC